MASFIDETIGDMAGASIQESAQIQDSAQAQAESEVDLEALTGLAAQQQLIANVRHLTTESKRRKTKDGRTCGETTTWDGVSYIGCTKAPTPDGEQKEEEWCIVDGKDQDMSRFWDFCDSTFNFDLLRTKVFELQSAEIPAIQKIKAAQGVLIQAAGQMKEAFDKMKKKQAKVVANFEAMNKANKALDAAMGFLKALKAKFDQLKKQVKAAEKEKCQQECFLETQETTTMRFKQKSDKKELFNQLKDTQQNKGVNNKFFRFRQRALHNLEKLNKSVKVKDLKQKQEIFKKAKEIQRLHQEHPAKKAQIIQIKNIIKGEPDMFDKAKAGLDAKDLLGKAKEVQSTTDKAKADKMARFLGKIQGMPRFQEQDIVVKDFTNSDEVQAPVDLENCDGIEGYEAPYQGDGLKCFYFNNENFMGPAVTRIEPQIDFDWALQPPAPGINPLKYSMRCTGFLKIVQTSSYTFRVKAVTGARLVVNNELLINHNFNFNPGCMGDQSIFDVQSPNGGINKDPFASSVTPLFLEAASKYPIIFEVYYADSFYATEQDDTFATLSWECAEIAEEIIPQQYLFTIDQADPLKVQGFSTTLYERSVFENGGYAYKDSQYFILDGIQEKMEGLTLIRTRRGFKEASFQFEASADIVLYIAIKAEDKELIPDSFTLVPFTIAVLEIAADAQPNAKGEIVAEKDQKMFIFNREFKKGKLDVPFEWSTDKTETDVLFFFKLDGKANEQEACGGEEIDLTGPSGEAFANCTSSSFIEGYSCENGLSGEFKDEPYKMWVTEDEGIGAWLRVDFKKQYQVNRVEYMNRHDPSQRNREIIFEINGVKKVVELRNNDEKTIIIIDPPVQSQFIKMTISGVYQTCKNGGAFSAWGLKCSSLKNGATFSEYGYIQESSSSSSSMTQEQIMEQYATTCDDNFEDMTEEEAKEKAGYPKVGDGVDVFDQESNSWVAGKVLTFDEISPGKLKYIFSKNDFPGIVSCVWPDDTVATKCGLKVQSKEHCPKKEGQDELKTFKVCFTSKSSCDDGYIPDTGKPFGPQGDLKFGWTRDVTKNARSRKANDDPLRAEVMLFPPDKKSTWCKLENPEVSCEKAEWSMEVPPGKYQVTLTAGDADISASYALKINGQDYLTKQLAPNEFFHEQKEITAADGKITVSQHCEKDCDNVWSRINSIVIKELDNSKKEKDETKNLGCGNSFEGGRCEKSDVINCVYPTENGTSQCTGSMQIVKIPRQSPCKEQHHKFKCVLIQYGSSDECLVNCPTSCNGTTCKNNL